MRLLKDTLVDIKVPNCSISTRNPLMYMVTVGMLLHGIKDTNLAHEFFSYSKATELRLKLKILASGMKIE